MTLSDITPEVEGRAADGAAVVGNPVLIAGSDGTNVRTIRTDTSGNLSASFSAADTTATGALGALNATVQIALAGQRGAAMQLTAGTLVGTLIVEYSFDGGTTWISSIFFNTVLTKRAVSLIFAANNTAQSWSLYCPAGTSHVRIKVSAYTSGTADVALRATTVIQDVVPPRFTYSAASVGLVVVAAATDFFTITGSATATVRVTRFEISGTQTTATVEDILVIRRTTANTGGTSTSPAAGPHDAGNNVAATAVVRAYTANPTVAGGDTLRAAKLLVPTALLMPPILSWTFGRMSTETEAFTLRGTGHVLAFNMNAGTATGNSFSMSVEWTEEIL